MVVSQSAVLRSAILPSSVINKINTHTSDKKSREKLLKVSDAILRRAAWNGFEPSTFFDVPKNLLQATIGNQYRKSIDALISIDVLDCDESYQFFNDGSKGTCKAYRFCESMTLPTLESLTLKTSKKAAKTLDEIEAKTAAVLDKLSLKIGNTFLSAKTPPKNADFLLKAFLTSKITPDVVKNRHIRAVQDDAVGYMYHWQKGTLTKSCNAVFNGRKAKQSACQMDIQLIQYKDIFVLSNDMNGFLNWKVNEIQVLAFLQLKSIINKDFYIGRNEENYRLDTSITNLSGLLESGLFLDYKPLLSLDLANSQFVIFSSIVGQILDGNGNLLDLLEKHFKDNKAKFSKHVETLKQSVTAVKIEKDFFTFKEAAETGTVYDDFAKASNISRDDAKKAFFLIAFGSVKVKGRLVTLFKKKYPSVFSIVQNFKNTIGDSKQFSIFLQAVESCIFIDELLPLLFKNGLHPLTKHDSILLKQNEFLIGERITKRVLDKNLSRYTLK
jgi:hypothetical protein